MLLLPIESFFFPAVGEEIAIGAFRGQDAVVVLGEAQLFLDFAVEGFEERLPFFYPALGKLPASWPVAALTNQDFSGWIPQDAGDIWAIGRHGRMYGRKQTSPQDSGDSRLHRTGKAESLPSRSPNVHIAQAKISLSRILCLQKICLLAAVIGIAGNLSAQEATPAPTPVPKFNTWEATLDGGKYVVNVADISFVSIHEYVVDNSARVSEVNIATSGSALVRFYFIEPNIPQAPSGIGQSTLNFAQEKAQEALDRTKTDDIWKKVVKNYPTSTHAHTVEFRLSSKDSLRKLFDSAEQSWLQQRAGRFKP